MGIYQGLIDLFGLVCAGGVVAAVVLGFAVAAAGGLILPVYDD
jgi:hypothetical protein